MEIEHVHFPAIGNFIQTWKFSLVLLIKWKRGFLLFVFLTQDKTPFYINKSRLHQYWCKMQNSMYLSWGKCKFTIFSENVTADFSQDVDYFLIYKFILILMVFTDQYYSCNIFTKLKILDLTLSLFEISFYFVALKLNADPLLAKGGNKVNSSFVLRCLLFLLFKQT